MAVKAALFDLDGTLLLENSNQPVPGVLQMMTELEEAGLLIAVASDRESRAATRRRLRDAGLGASVVLDRSMVGKAKGSPLWPAKALETLDVAPNELVSIGDSNGDMRSASNSRIVYFNASWSSPGYPYGIEAESPLILSLILRECFMRESDWYWDLRAKDYRGRNVCSKAMLDGTGAGVPELKQDLISAFKSGWDPKIGPLRMRRLTMLQLLGNIVADGLYQGTDIWTVYPGHLGGVNEAMGPSVSIAAKLFRSRYQPDLLERHQQSADSGQRRSSGQSSEIHFLNQINTIHLESGVPKSLKGKSVLVLDDFLTEGYSSECARNLLLEAGADEVVSIVIGKYGYPPNPGQQVISPRPAHHWDPYKATEHDRNDFIEVRKNAPANETALASIRQSYERVRSWHAPEID